MGGAYFTKRTHPPGSFEGVLMDSIYGEGGLPNWWKNPA